MHQFAVGQRVMISPDTDKTLLAGCTGSVHELKTDFCVVEIDDFRHGMWSFVFDELLPMAATTTIDVIGANESDDAQIIRSALVNVSGVIAVQVNVHHTEVVVCYDDRICTTDALQLALENAGYHPIHERPARPTLADPQVCRMPHGQNQRDRKNSPRSH